MKHYLAIGLTMLSACTFVSCNDDSDPSYSIESPTINDDAYTFGGTLKLLYSTDGTNFSETAPANLGKNSVVTVKVNNGTTDLASDNFIFDWSGSSVAPADADAAVAEFTVADENPYFNVVVKDKQVLLTSHRNKGRFYSVNPANGDTTFLFKITYDGGTLKDTRGFTYHKGQDKFFISQASNSNGRLYSVDIDTKVATLINNNDGNDGEYAVWDAIVNWAVAKDDSLIAVGDFNGDGNGIVKFGTDGGRSLKTAQADICCGLGMLFDAASETMIIANGWDTNDKELLFDTYDVKGNAHAGVMLRDFEGFPADGVEFNDEWVTVKAMAKTHEGVFAIAYPSDAGKSYLVKIDLDARKVTYVKTLGDNSSNQFNTLAVVPTYAFN